jgi:hypothetical protein
VVEPHEDESERPADALVCRRENRPVDALAPRCLHPSSYCRFRDFCEVVDALRRMRREASKDGS